MSLSTQESILLALNQRSKEVATMFALAKEQQGIAKSLLERAELQTNQVKKQTEDYDKIAAKQFKGALEKGLDEIGNRITRSVLNESIGIANSNNTKVKEQIAGLIDISGEITGNMKLLSIRFLLTIVGGATGIGLIFFLIFSLFIKYQRTEIIENNAALSNQKIELSLLSEKGVKVQKFDNGTWITAPRGFISGTCGTAQCIQLP